MVMYRLLAAFHNVEIILPGSDRDIVVETLPANKHQPPATMQT